MNNPFLNRGSLAGLINKRNYINTTMEGESPFNKFMARKKGRQVDEAINQFAQRPMARPQQPMMRPQPMPQAAPIPQPAPIVSPGGFGNVGASIGGGQVPLITAEPQQNPMPPPQQMPAQGGGWNALGLGGFDPRMMRGFGYGGYGGGFGGFSAQQPFRPLY